MWCCPQLHVHRPGYADPCRCQLCQTLGGIYLNSNYRGLDEEAEFPSRWSSICSGHLFRENPREYSEHFQQCYSRNTETVNEVIGKQRCKKQRCSFCGHMIYVVVDSLPILLQHNIWPTYGWPLACLTRFNKISTQGAPQMAADKEANSLSRVYSYYSKFNLRLFYV